MKKVKKVFIGCFIWSLIFSKSVVRAETPTSYEYTENNIVYTIKDGVAKVSDYIGQAQEITIPETVNGAKVTSIGGEAFSQCTSLRKVSFSSGIEKIEDSLGWDSELQDYKSAFSNCENLKEVEIPEESKLFYIGSRAFFACENLTDICLPNSVKTLSYGCFYRCTSLTDFVLPDEIESVEAEVFAYTKLKWLHLPVSCSEFHYNQYLEDLEMITVEAGNETYKSEDGVLLEGHHRILIYPLAKKDTSYVIADDIYDCSANAFEGVKYLKSLDIGKAEISNMPYIQCEISVREDHPYYMQKDGFIYTKDEKELICVPAKKTGKVVIKSGVEKINRIACYKRKISEIILPDSLKKIETEAFAYCENLKRIYFKGAISDIEENAFLDIYTNVFYPKQYNKDTAERRYDYGGQVSWYAYDAKTEIFSSGKINKLTWKLNITGSLEITGTGDMINWKQYFDTPWNQYDKLIEEIILEDGVQTIGRNAFVNCPQIKNVKIYNTKCEIKGWNQAFPSNNITIYGYKGSTAQKAAEENQCEFKLLSKRNQRITASSYTKTYGSKAFSLGAKTSGNGKLSYSSSNKKAAAVSSGGKVTIKGYGSTTITIRAASTGQYHSALKKIRIKVVPKRGYLKSATSPAKKKIKILWSKNSTVSGYQIYLSKKKDFSKDTKQNRYSMKKTSVTVGGWKSKTTYYVKIRSYKTVGKTKYYGAWSTIKSVKVK